MKLQSQSWLAVVLAGLFAIAVSDTTFLQPPGPGPAGNYRDNSVHTTGKEIQIEWTSTLARMDLIVWQDYPRTPEGTSIIVKLSVNTRSTSYIWPVRSLMAKVPPGEAAVIFFTVHATGNPAIDGSSHYVNVTVPLASTTTSAGPSTSTSSITPSSSATSSSASVTTSPSSAIPTSEPNSSSTLSSGAIAGISVGAVVAGVAILGGLGFLVWKRYSNRNRHEPVPPQAPKYGGPQTQPQGPYEVP